MGYAISEFGSKRGPEARLLDTEAIRLGELDQAAKTPPLLGLVVDEDFSEAVVEKGIAEPFDDGRPIGLGLLFHADPGEDGEHLLAAAVVAAGSVRAVTP